MATLLWWKNVSFSQCLIVRVAWDWIVDAFASADYDLIFPDDETATNAVSLKVLEMAAAWKRKQAEMAANKPAAEEEEESDDDDDDDEEEDDDQDGDEEAGSDA